MTHGWVARRVCARGEDEAAGHTSPRPPPLGPHAHSPMQRTSSTGALTPATSRWSPPRAPPTRTPSSRRCQRGERACRERMCVGVGGWGGGGEQQGQLDAGGGTRAGRAGARAAHTPLDRPSTPPVSSTHPPVPARVLSAQVQHAAGRGGHPAERRAEAAGGHRARGGQKPRGEPPPFAPLVAAPRSPLPRLLCLAARGSHRLLRARRPSPPTPPLTHARPGAAAGRGHLCS